MGVAHIKLPERFNLAAAIVDTRVREGKGDTTIRQGEDCPL